MSHAADSIAIEPALHADLKAAAANHAAAGIAGSPLAAALAGDTTVGGQITNATLTAYATAVEGGPLHGVTEPARQALIARLTHAFPKR